MKLKTFIPMLAALALAHHVFAEEDDKPVSFANLPAAVATAIKEAAGDAKLESIVLGDEDGTPAYEATWNAGGHKHEIAVAKDGTVLCIEEIITLKEAPEAVQEAITKEAGSREVLEVEKVIAKGKTVYEAEIKEGKGKMTVTFTEAGKVLERENAATEKAEKKEKKKKN